MINDLDATITALLNKELSSALPDVQITFATPDDKFATQSGSPRVNFFLYDIRENRDLRDPCWSETEIDDYSAVRRFPPPIRVDFSYIVTAWPSETVPEPWEDEHRILGAVLSVLVRYQSMPQEYLEGQLRNQDLPLPINTLHPGRLQSPGEFWQALGGTPKATLNYQVTLAVARQRPDEQGERIPLVYDKKIDVRLRKGGPT